MTSLLTMLASVLRRPRAAAALVAPLLFVLVAPASAFAQSDLPPRVTREINLAGPRFGVTMLSPGTIDADYRGEVKVLLINLGLEPVEILPGDRIAQLVVAPVSRLRLIEVESLPSTDRGAGGFGSTGR